MGPSETDNTNEVEYISMTAAIQRLDSSISNFQKPKAAKEAFHGLTGIFQYIAPETEADPMGLLISFLVAYGNMAGRNSYYQVGATRHYSNLFATLVGETSKARKGTGLDIIKKICKSIDPDWVKLNIKSGLASGEGLKYNVRDTVTKVEKGKEVMTDKGVEDKRLLIIESEFASVLKVANRAGNTLSTTMRDAWDTGNLSTLTKNDPVTATDAHISILGHITLHELVKDLTQTEAANGHANRILWTFVRRSNLLPFGGNIDWNALPYENFKVALEFARNPRQLSMDEGAKKVWKKIYIDLSRGEIGLLGAVTSRSEAQVTRLALTYALLDCSEVIRAEHLRAALAVWKYCEASAKFIFGEKFGDETVDTIFSRLKQKGKKGMTTTEFHNIFGNNKSKEEIERGLLLLLQHEKIKVHTRSTGGRPTQFYEINEISF